MPENHDFEKAMQQQLDGFQVTPKPSDWQAVYEQLHPTKKRRPIWWWIPALLMMLALAWYISKEPNGTAQQAKTNVAQQSIQAKSVPDQINAGGPQVASSPTSAETEEIKTVSEKVSDQQSPSSTKSAAEHTQTSDKAPIAKDAVAKTEKAKTSRPKIEKSSIPTSTKSKQTPTYKNVAFVAPQSGEQATFNNTATPTFPDDLPNELIYNLGLVQNAFANKNMIVASTLPAPIPQKNTQDNDRPKNTASQKKQSTKWQWGVYVGIGANRLTEPIGMMKSSADNVAAGSGSSRVVTSSTEQNGWHYDAGFFVNRKWNRNWQFTTGLGVNVSTWASSSTSYIDSLLPAGSVFSRQLVSTVEQSNTMWMLELPLQISNRIAGKSAGTFWWTAGINNQFLLTLKAETTTSRLQNNFASTTDEKSLTSGVNKYQPQLRAGFIYDYAGKKTHWQLVPLLNIGLVKPLQSGDFNLMNMQLQGRWFFGR